MRRGSPGNAWEPQPFPEASQAGAVPAERGAGRGLLLGLGVQGFGQTLHPSPDAPKHTLQCPRWLGGWPVLCDVLLDWRREGTVRVLPREVAPPQLSPPPSGRQGWQSRSPWKPTAPQRLLAASREGSGFKTLLCYCFCLYYPICLCTPTPLLLQPQMALFYCRKASHPTVEVRGRVMILPWGWRGFWGLGELPAQPTAALLTGRGS